jgi:dihydroorotate dehydrogenase
MTIRSLPATTMTHQHCHSQASIPFGGYERLRSFLFRFDPELMHTRTLQLLRLAAALSPIRFLLRRTFAYQNEKLRVRIMGLDFPNPVGLAAGYDKDGAGMKGLTCLGFGHIELGTVTPHPQAGNPRPRIFRLTEDYALINRMGFPNQGAAALLKRLKKAKFEDVVVGVNIGKGVGTPLDEAAQDYLQLLQCYYAYADYVAINVSSPNTVGLRRLQAKEQLSGLLESLSKARAELRRERNRYVPLLVKLAPDLSEFELKDALEVIQSAGMDGVIAANTTVRRNGLASSFQTEIGGLSGVPLRKRARQMVSQISEFTAGKLPIIGVGGIHTPEDAKAMLDAGASLVQVYTGLVYQGPGLVRWILEELAKAI